MKKYLADKTCANILRVVALLVSIALIFVVWYYLRPIPILMWILASVFAAVYILAGAIWLPLFLKTLVYNISPDEIVVNSGVIFRNKVIMKTSAVRHITLVTTPFSKATGLNFVIVNVMGGNAILSFISWKDCEKILRTLRGICSKQN